MSLAEYRRKRRFDSTPEPSGGSRARSKPLQFVVQKHAASHLHFDFRLEVDGVLKSWAVPKGPSLDPVDKRLAIMVEDHPLDYGSFEGTIPPGNYGAGTVMVWDAGTYTSRDASDRAGSESSMRKGLAAGHLTFVLDGSKLRGEFSLLKLKRGKPNEWLLVKKNDEFAEPGSELDQHSAQSGRTMDEITAGARGHKKPAKKGKAVAVARPADAGSEMDTKRPAAMRVRPMLATLVDRAFNRDNWFFEVKWDGFRAIAEIDHGSVSLYSRNHKSFNERFAPIVETLATLKVNAILDGEIVVLDAQGKSQFQLLQNYQRTGQGQLVYYVFDLLELNGKDWREEPLEARKKALAKVIKNKGNVLLSEHIEGDGLSFFKAAAQQGLEGIVAKNASSHYREGSRGTDWLKIKTQMRQEAVIGGFTRPKGTRQQFGALVLGLYDGDEFNYIGHTGGGFDSDTLAEVRARLEPLTQSTCPFKKRPHTNTPAQWVKPEVVCEVKFAEWTKDGLMRQPVFIGLRDDKKASIVGRELKLPAKDVVQAAEAAPSAAAKNGKPQPASKAKKSRPPAKENDSHLTHPDKVYWPEEGYTKADLFAYYRSVARTMLPYLKDRPQSMHRYPNGITGQSFFQKDVSKQPPPVLQTAKVKLEDGRRTIVVPLCQDLDSLLYLVNLGCIEINPWNSRLQSLDHPDYLIIDLDPEEVPFEKVAEVAVAVHKALDAAACPNYCKTSGKRGIHIFVPLGAKYPYEQARQFAEVVAQVVHARHQELTSLERSPSKRQHQVYLDYLQNIRGATLAAPYSARPHPGATVSTPLKWSEVNRRLDPNRFTIQTIPQRLDKQGDLWGPVLGEGVDLEHAVKRLAALAKAPG